MDSFAAIIDLWPSPAELGADLGQAAGTVRQWKNRNRIPADQWRPLIEAAKQRGLQGLSLEVLAELAERDRRPARVA